MKRVIWILGAGSGIGEAVSCRLATSGYHLVLSGRRSERLSVTRSKVLDAGGLCEARPVDVRQRIEVKELHDQILSEFGFVSILINCVGVNVPNRTLDAIGADDWDNIIQTNLSGVFYPVQSVLAGMRAAGDGLVITVSSWVGRHPAAVNGAAYAASKRALSALSESINQEENRHGIRSTVIFPGGVDTELLDQRAVPLSREERLRLLRPLDVAVVIENVVGMPSSVVINEVLMSPSKRKGTSNG